jgi:hypothetical protein
VGTSTDSSYLTEIKDGGGWTKIKSGKKVAVAKR